MEPPSEYLNNESDDGILGTLNGVLSTSIERDNSRALIMSFKKPPAVDSQSHSKQAR